MLHYAYVWHFLLIAVVQDVVEHINIRFGLDSDACSHAKIVDVLDHLFGIRFLIRLDLRRFGSS